MKSCCQYQVGEVPERYMAGMAFGLIGADEVVEAAGFEAKTVKWSTSSSKPGVRTRAQPLAMAVCMPAAQCRLRSAG